MGALVSDVPDVAADRVPGERLGWFALVQHDLFRALWRRRRVKPLAGQVGWEHDRSPVVNIDHAAGGVRGDDHESMLLGLLIIIEPGELPDGRA